MKVAINGKVVDIEVEETALEIPVQYYGELVARLVRQRYSQSNVEAIINNYLGDNGNEQYQSEFKALQEYRKECKAKAREILGQ